MALLSPCPCYLLIDASLPVPVIRPVGDIVLENVATNVQYTKWIDFAQFSG
jgi:hypothetical protein